METICLQIYRTDTDGLQDVFFLTSQTPFTLGSDRQNTLVYSHRDVAPHHAEIKLDAGQVWLCCLSPDGTLILNGNPITHGEPMVLNIGDRLSIGKLQLGLSVLAGRPSTDAGPLPITLVTPLTHHHLLQVQTPNWVQDFSLHQAVHTLGSAADCDISLDCPGLLPQQLKLTWSDGTYVVHNLGPADSLKLRGQGITQHSLQDGDTFSLGSELSLQYTILSPEPPTPDLAAQDLRSLNHLTLGRDSRNDLTLSHPVVSRFHAVLEKREQQWFVIDLQSANGTYLNGQAVDRAHLLPGQSLHVGPYEFQLTDSEQLVQRFKVGRLRLDACSLTYRVGQQLKLLDDISLSILPEEFVTIVGVSGAGKSTLLNALSAFRPATRGAVFVNGHNLYRHFDAYRSELGYVPQDDIIHRELTVQQALNFAARLRLPKDISAGERQRQVAQVLQDLELAAQAQNPVRTLSGGQRKRVSIGVELLTKPSLFFLDEATSGLDPGTELQMMRLLRQIASQGRSVILVTHTTKNLGLSDLVVFLAKGGRVAFFGPPQEALDYFGVQEFDEIYIKVENERSPAEWAAQYQQSDYFRTYVSDRQSALEISTASGQPTPPYPTKGLFDLRQLLLLSQRHLAILWRDRSTFLFLLAITPVLGLLDLVLWRRDMFDATTGDPSQCFTLLFITVLIAVIVGSLSTMRDIVKEAEIYRRERLIGLRITPYILSKVGISAILAAYQSAIILGTKVLLVDFPGDQSTLLAMFFTLFLATLGGMVMGLLVSALATSQNMAPLLTILFLIPQITLAGAFLPLHSVGPVGQFASQLTLTRWTYEAMVTLSGVGVDIATDPCWQVSETTRTSWNETDKRNCQCMGPNLYQRCYFPGLYQEFDAAVNQTEPKQPESPGTPPPIPDPLTPLNIATYRDDLQTYGDETDAYQQAVDAWQERFSEWKERRGRSLAAGEELLARFRKNQGKAYGVNVQQHWLRLCLLITAMVLSLFALQKRKDWV